MKVNNKRSSFTLSDFYKDEIPLDTAQDARWFLSLLTSFFPAVSVTFGDGYYIVDNVFSHYQKKIKVIWKYKV